MKNFIFLLLIFCKFYLNAQTIIGNASVGTTIKYPNFTIISNVVGNGDSISFDIDCDSIPDLKFVVVRGAMPLDGRSNLYIGSLDTNVEICLNPSPGAKAIHYYSASDTVICDSPFFWSNDKRYLFSCFGLDCMAVNNVSDTFIVYRKKINLNTYQYGWARISFNLYEPSPKLTLKEYLTFCYPLYTDNLVKDGFVKVYPTIFDNIITIESTYKGNYLVEIYNSYIQKILSSKNKESIKTDYFPAGLYYLKIIKNNTLSTYKLIKL